jgi:hypothetical protein
MAPEISPRPGQRVIRGAACGAANPRSFATARGYRFHISIHEIQTIAWFMPRARSRPCVELFGYASAILQVEALASGGGFGVEEFMVVELGSLRWPVHQNIAAKATCPRLNHHCTKCKPHIAIVDHSSEASPCVSTSSSARGSLQKWNADAAKPSALRA